MTAAELYERLKERPTSHAFTAVPIPDHAESFIAIDAQGRPCLFIQAHKRSAEPPMKTSNVSLQLDTEYSLSTEDGTSIRQHFHALCCEASDDESAKTFLSLIDAFLARAPRPPTAQTLSLYFRSLIRLFSVRPANDVKTARQGLWGELFLMRSVKGFDFWLTFWHTDPSRRFDFSSDGHRVEVKTTVGGPRLHHFSHRQVFALDGEEIAIASLLLQEDDAGLSLRALVDECRAAAVRPDDYLKLEKSVRRVGMADTSDAGPSYDPVHAANELGWYRSTDVPRFLVPEPAGVSETRYRIDLSTAPRWQLQDLNDWLDAWAALPTSPTAAFP